MIIYLQTDIMCHYLAVRCLLEAKEFTEALQVIVEMEMCSNISQSGISFNNQTDVLNVAPRNVSYHYGRTMNLVT